MTTLLQLGVNRYLENLKKETKLNDFYVTNRMLCDVFISGVEVTNRVIIKAMFLDMTVDAPARAMWQAIKQFNGKSGCGRCIETGEHLDL